MLKVPCKSINCFVGLAIITLNVRNTGIVYIYIYIYTVDPIMLLFNTTIGELNVIMQYSPIQCHEDLLSLHPMLLPKRFDHFPPCLGDAQRV